MFDPPPYDFLAPKNSVAMPAPILGRGGKGLSGCGCGCKGAGTCGGGDHSHGLGFFESGMDYSQWGAMEWGAIAVGGYVVVSAVFDVLATKSKVSACRKAIRSRR